MCPIHGQRKSSAEKRKSQEVPESDAQVELRLRAARWEKAKSKNKKASQSSCARDLLCPVRSKVAALVADLGDCEIAPPPLPPGWAEAQHNGQVYYFNSAGLTQWHRPTA